MLSWMLDLALSNIPTWAWLAGAIGSLAVFLLSGILSHFPAVGIYAKIIKPISGLLTLVCVFMYGGAGVQAMWEEKARLAQEAADQAALASAEANKKLDAERRKKQQVITQYIDRVKETIVVQKEVIDAKCEVPPEAVIILNDAARNPTGAKK